ncbi:MAG: hypothetical protein IKP48_10170 [Bacteroidaceae bacterium]|nr:hypothetical protein [Bacteroidaceae bacterium]
MKKLLLLLVCTFFCAVSFADDIDLKRRPPVDTGGNKAPALYPSASYDNGSVTIYAPYYIDSMTVVIADVNEDDIYTVQLGGFIGQQSIVLPDIVDEDKYSIYLYFNGICLYGLF